MLHDKENRAPALENGAPTPTLGDRVRSLRLAERTGPAPKTGSGALPWAVCVILLLMTTAFGYRAYRAGPVGSTAGSSEGDKERGGDGKGTYTGSPSSATGDVVLQAKGYVVAVHPVQVSPKVGGMLVEVSPRLEEGRIFKEGEVLAKIEDVDYRADRDQAKYALRAAEERLREMEAGNRPEEIEQAKAELDEADENMDLAKRDHVRAERTRAIIAANEYDKIRSTYRAASERLKRARQSYKLMYDGPRIEKKLAGEAEVRQNRAMLAKAQWRLENCIIRAPVTGTITSKRAERGNIVNPGAFSTGSAGGISASLCDMADLRDIEIDLSIQERDVATVEENQECLIMPEAYQNDKRFLAKHPHGYVGFVSRLMPTADRAKGAVPVRVRIPRESIPPDEAGKYLRPDMGALVSFKRVASNDKK